MLHLLILFAHLLGSSLALGAIVATDIRLIAKFADDQVRIAPPNPFVMRLITFALLLLIATGSALIVQGLQHDPAYLDNPKLQAKLVLVLVLSLNALVLHHLTFPRLARGRPVARWRKRDFVRVAVPVSLSNSLWLYCAFLGIARPWSNTVSRDFVLWIGFALFLATLALVSTLLGIAAHERPHAATSRIDALKRRLGALAHALQA